MVGTKKKLFLCFSPSKNLEIIVWQTCPPSQSIGRGRISREGALDRLIYLIIARVENGVTKFSPQSDRKRQNFQKNWIRKTVFSGEFQFTNFHFFGRGKTNFFWATSMITMSIDIVSYSLSLLSLDRLLPSKSVNMFLSSSPWRTPPRLLTPPSYITPPQASLTASNFGSE